MTKQMTPGQAFRTGEIVAEAIHGYGFPDHSDFQNVLGKRSRDFAEDVRRLVRWYALDLGSISYTLESFPVRVKYGQLQSQIEAGNYDWCIPDPKLYPRSRFDEKDIVAQLISLESNNPPEPEDRVIILNPAGGGGPTTLMGIKVLEQLEVLAASLGMRLGIFDEMLAFGARYPGEITRDKPSVYASGSWTNRDMAGGIIPELCWRSGQIGIASAMAHSVAGARHLLVPIDA